jgi:hypothetical protein
MTYERVLAKIKIASRQRIECGYDDILLSCTNRAENGAHRRKSQTKEMSGPSAVWEGRGEKKIKKKNKQTMTL